MMPRNARRRSGRTEISRASETAASCAARQHAVRAARLLDQLGDAREFARAADQVHVRQPLEDFLAVLLRHAAEDADHQAGLAALQALELADIAVHALLGVRAHRAGVVEHHVGFLGRGGLFVAGAPQRGERQLGVQLVHLAAEGVDEDLVRHTGFLIILAMNSPSPPSCCGRNSSCASRRKPGAERSAAATTCAFSSGSTLHVL